MKLLSSRKVVPGKGIKRFGLRPERIRKKKGNHMALKDIIPLDAFFGGENPRKKKKKVDREALASPIMRVPRMDVRAARDLLDIGIRELYQLQGRSAESLMEDIRAKKPDAPEYRLPHLRLAIYFAENEEPDPDKLHPSVWMD
jgi:hypothetical protein